jgi:hypothetical protein
LFWVCYGPKKKDYRNLIIFLSAVNTKRSVGIRNCANFIDTPHYKIAKPTVE